MASFKMPFGKHRGKRLTAIPTEYLVWLLESSDTLEADLRKAVDLELGRRDDAPKKEPEPEPERKKATPDEPRARNLSPMGQTLTGSVRMLYRGLALKYHPDRGGSKDAMEALNELHDQIQELINRTFNA